MSSILSAHSTHKRSPSLWSSRTMASRLVIKSAISVSLLGVVVATTGCSTTHEFKPTATVMVGAHKSL